MRIKDMLYFSPKYSFSKLKWDDKKFLIKAFKDRVKGFYLKPAEELNRERKGFASGVLCVVLIDFLARITTGDYKTKRRFKKWLKENITEFNCDSAEKFYNDFRNGLVHEGRIKNCGQFSYEIGEIVYQDDNVMVVNPELLLEKIKRAFANYVKRLQEDNNAFEKFRETLRKDFEQEIRLTQEK